MKRLTNLPTVGLFLALASIAFAFIPGRAEGAVPKLINFQGILKDGSGNPVANGSYFATFRIYNAPSGGTVLWADTQTVATGSGLFNATLGVGTPVPDSVFNDTSRYLGITVFPDPEMTPRQRLISVTYAYRLSTVDGASGGTITSKVSIGPGHTNTGVNAFVVGENNTASGDWSTVGGGRNNKARGLLSIVAGGGGTILPDSNLALGDYSAVGGGARNKAIGPVSTVGGGADNTAGGDQATVSGGNSNTANGNQATVSGGYFNTGNGNFATVAGGFGNAASLEGGTVGGGKWDTVSGAGATVGGGVANTASGSYATVGGGSSNIASGDWATVGGVQNTASGFQATVGGGSVNIANGSIATVGGGAFNSANNLYATVGGGRSNTANGDYATVGGGYINAASLDNATVGGGAFNTASGSEATVGGGFADTASGIGATVPGGYVNRAQGAYSFAAGFFAIANHPGAFVWADHSSFAAFASSAANQFNIRAAGGMRIYSNPILTAGVSLAAGASAWAFVSDSTLKRNIRVVDCREMLDKVIQLPIKRWSYKAQDPKIEHIGPMAQDFYPLFQVGDDEKTISTIDPPGIALAAIQGLYQIVQEQKAENKELKASNAELSTEMKELKKLVQKLLAKNEGTGQIYTLNNGQKGGSK